MERKTDQAYETIKDRIITGEYPPMMDISEEAIQKELKMSRTPVREALIRLREDGFILVYPKKGTLVSAVSLDLINDIYEVRGCNEPEICIRASQYIPKEVLLELRKQFSETKKIPDDPENRKFFVKLDDRLHTTILRYCGNPYFIKTMKLVYLHNERFRNFSSNPVSDGSIAEHIQLIDAILSKDPEKIRAASEAHLRASKRIAVNSFIKK